MLVLGMGRAADHHSAQTCLIALMIGMLFSHAFTLHFFLFLLRLMFPCLTWPSPWGGGVAGPVTDDGFWCRAGGVHQ